MLKGNNTISSVLKGSSVINIIKKGLITVYEAFKELIISGIPPLALNKSIGKDLEDYKIYGNSIQDGTPTPDNPVEIQSVGEKTCNLFDVSKSLGFESQYGGLTNTIDGNVITVECSVQSRGGYLKLGTFEAGNYYISANFITGIDYARVVLNDKIMSIENYTIRNGKGIVIEISQDTNIQLYNSFSNDNIVKISDIQIVESNIPKAYEPYGYKIPIKLTNESGESETKNIYLDEPLRKVGDYADYIDFENGKVYRTIGEYSFKGTEYFAVSTNTTSTSLVCYTNNITPAPKISAINGFCNIGNVGRYDQIKNYDNGFFYNLNSSHFLKIQKSTITNYDDTLSNSKKIILFKEYIANLYSAGIPVKILYELATPTEETIELPNIPTLKGTNIIEVDTEIQPSNMAVKYKGLE